MMHTNKNLGSALLIVLILLSSLLIVCATVWRSTAYILELTLCRHLSEQQHQLTNAGLMWAGALIYEYGTQVEHHLEQAPEIVIFFAHWPFETPQHLSIDYQMKLALSSGEGNSLKCSALLLKKNEKILMLTCSFRRIHDLDQSHPRLFMYDWHPEKVH